MDLLKLLIGLEKDTCLLCFKCDKNNLDIYSTFEIHHEYKTILRSVKDMLKTLFPLDEIIFKQVCDECLELVFKMYILVSKQKIKRLLLDSIIKQIDREISKISQDSEHDGSVCIKLQTPTFFKENDQPADNGGHTDNISNEATFVCALCGDHFESEKALKQHELDHKKSLKTCPHCHETFQFQNKYQAHLKTHKKRRKPTYYCNDCNYKTVSKTTLHGHMNKNHLQTRPHICQVCFKGFYNRSNLNEHIQTHNSHRNEICEVCGCSFLHKKNLIEHLRLHSDTQPYECRFCSKKFVTNGRRSEHIKRSHMEKSECCLICNKKYSLKKDLSRHMNTVHNMQNIFEKQD